MYDYYEAQKNCPCGSFAYVIKSGDTLYKLAITYNTTVEAIMKVNPGLNPNNLRVGQRICIPKSTPVPPKCPMGTFAYTIKSGDTLYKLAITYNTTVEAIMRVNPGIDPNNLQIGQVICIPESTPVPPKCPMGTFAYTIKSGDTLYKLAITYNTTVEAIMKVNPGIDPNNLQIGQVICIPESTPVPPTCPIGTFAYTIKAGDTIYNLAITYNTTVEAILSANPGLNPNNLQIGQVICIPRSTPVPPCDGLYYTVRPGDTLFSIAQMFNIPLATLIAANPGVDPNNLMVGQLLCIPKVMPPISCPGGTVYTVRCDDSLGTILLRFNLSVMDIKASNPNVDIYNLREGQQLCIMPHMERGCPCGPGFKSYTIMPSDIPMDGSVVVAIARKFNISVENLMIANPNLTPSHFEVGQMICVPY
jgi:LysM repeat protein